MDCEWSGPLPFAPRWDEVKGSQVPDVVVVGAGIVGAAIAYQAARRGAAVTLVDTSLPGSGATGDSFAWIGVHGDVPGAAADLHAAALDAYRALEVDVPGVRVRWTGSLSWPAPAVSPSTLAGRESAGPREDVHVLDAAQAAQVEPNLRRPPDRAVHTTGDAAVDPVAVTEALVRAARGHGCEVRIGVTATALRSRRGLVIGLDTSAAFLPADTVVVAAGVGVPLLCAPLGFDVPVAPSPAVLMRFDAPNDVVRTLVASPQLEVRQGRDGELLATGGPEAQASRSDVERAAEGTRAMIAATFVGADTVQSRSARVGVRPMPVDGTPIVGPLPGVRGVYLAVMHSGVTLAPVVGHLVAAEILTGRQAVQLAGCRPARFTREPTSAH